MNKILLLIVFLAPLLCVWKAFQEPLEENPCTGGAANCVATFSALQISAAIGEITGKVECNRCGNTFQTPDDLNEHIAWKHVKIWPGLGRLSTNILSGEASRR